MPGLNLSRIGKKAVRPAVKQPAAPPKIPDEVESPGIMETGGMDFSNDFDLGGFDTGDDVGMGAGADDFKLGADDFGFDLGNDIGIEDTADQPKDTSDDVDFGFEFDKDIPMDMDILDGEATDTPQDAVIDSDFGYTSDTFLEEAGRNQKDSSSETVGSTKDPSPPLKKKDDGPFIKIPKMPGSNGKRSIGKRILGVGCINETNFHQATEAETKESAVQAKVQRSQVTTANSAKAVSTTNGTQASQRPESLANTPGRRIGRVVKTNPKSMGLTRPTTAIPKASIPVPTTPTANAHLELASGSHMESQKTHGGSDNRLESQKAPAFSRPIQRPHGSKQSTPQPTNMGMALSIAGSDPFKTPTASTKMNADSIDMDIGPSFGHTVTPDIYSVPQTQDTSLHGELFAADDGNVNQPRSNNKTQEHDPMDYSEMEAEGGTFDVEIEGDTQASPSTSAQPILSFEEQYAHFQANLRETEEIQEQLVVDLLDLDVELAVGHAAALRFETSILDIYHDVQASTDKIKEANAILKSILEG